MYNGNGKPKSQTQFQQQVDDAFRQETVAAQTIDAPYSTSPEKRKFSLPTVPVPSLKFGLGRVWLLDSRFLGTVAIQATLGLVMDPEDYQRYLLVTSAAIAFLLMTWGNLRGRTWCLEMVAYLTTATLLVMTLVTVRSSFAL